MTTGNQVIQVAVARPYVTLEEYADQVGVSKGAVYGWARAGLIKTIKRGKWVLVNNMAESIEAAAQADAVNLVIQGAA